MKKAVASNQKGHVGKSAIICQYAHYLNSLGLRVLVIGSRPPEEHYKSIDYWRDSDCS